MPIQKMFALVSTVLAIASVTPVHAQDAAADPKWYAELGYTQFLFHSRWDTPGPAPTISFSQGAPTLTLGYRLWPHLAVEGLMAGGVSRPVVRFRDPNGVTVLATTVRADVRNVTGLFVKPSLPITDRLHLFGRLGWVFAQHRLYPEGGTFSIDNDGVSYGIGLSFDLSRASYVQANWTNYFKKGFDESSSLVRIKTYGLNLSYGHRF